MWLEYKQLIIQAIFGPFYISQLGENEISIVSPRFCSFCLGDVAWHARKQFERIWAVNNSKIRCSGTSRCWNSSETTWSTQLCNLRTNILQTQGSECALHALLLIAHYLVNENCKCTISEFQVVWNLTSQVLILVLS